ncbi:MAG: response regulator [Phycisphaerales bacterium]|nr:response regulator [Phycisphaerales bacterium]
MKNYLLILCATAGSILAIGCGVNGNWSLGTVDPSASRRYVEYHTLTLQKDGTFYAEAKEESGIKTTSGTYTYKDGVLHLVAHDGESHTYDAKVKSSGNHLELRELADGQRITMVFSVADTGIGISAEYLPSIFQRYHQEDSSVSRGYRGLGLGLSIVKQLVEMHGGTVRAQSEGANRGAMFVVSLPTGPQRGGKVAGADIATRAAANWESINLSGIRILVVDDEPDSRELVRRLLNHYHAEVVTAAGATEAMDVLKGQRIDLIFSDIGMPGIDGYQFIRKVRELSRAQGGAVPAIALTAFTRSEDRTRALVAGYQMHIAKPIEPRELVAAAASFSGRAT